MAKIGGCIVQKLSVVCILAVVDEAMQIEASWWDAAAGWLVPPYFDYIPGIRSTTPSFFPPAPPGALPDVAL